jgi:hypothetical protein
MIAPSPRALNTDVVARLSAVRATSAGQERAYRANVQPEQRTASSDEASCVGVAAATRIAPRPGALRRMARLLPLLRLLLCASVAAAYTELRYTLNATDSSYVRALATSSADSGDRFAAPLPLCMSAGVFAEALARVAAADLLPGGVLDGRTVFAPSDSAFDAALSALSLSRASFFASPERLAETLALHIAAPGQLPLNTRDVGTGAPARRISSALGAPPLLLERRMVARTDVVIVPSNIAGEPPTSQTVIVQVCIPFFALAPPCRCCLRRLRSISAALQLGAARAGCASVALPTAAADVTLRHCCSIAAGHLACVVVS